MKTIHLDDSTTQINNSTRINFTDVKNIIFNLWQYHYEFNYL